MTFNGGGYGAFLRQLGEDVPDTVVIDTGVATSMFTGEFQGAFPQRYYNLGIAEQNAVSVASGLARRGYIPLVHSFANFLARRAHDQIAVSVAWPGANVKLIAGSCGVFDGRGGPSHTAVDDLASVSSLPGMMVAEPGDLAQTRELLFRIAAYPGPAYLRLRRYGTPQNLLGEQGIGAGSLVVSEHPRAVCTLVTAGSLLAEAIQAARMLGDAGLRVDLIQVPILRPLDAGPILASARKTRWVAVMENHGARGGLGDAVAAVTGPMGVRQDRFALPDEFLPAGDADWLLRYCGLDAASVAQRLTALLQTD